MTNKDSTNRYEEFGTLLGRFLDREDRSASWLSKHLVPSVDPSTPTKWLNGQNRPGGPSILDQICDLLNLTDEESRDLFKAADYAYLRTDASKKRFLDKKLSDARDWDRKEREEGYLYREGKLAELREFVNAKEREIPDIVQKFLAVGIKHQNEIDIKEKWRRVYVTTLAGFLGGGIGAMLWVLLFSEPSWGNLIGTSLVYAFLALIISYFISLSKEFGPLKMVLPLIVGCLVGAAPSFIQLLRSSSPQAQVSLGISLILSFGIALCITRNNIITTLLFCLMSAVLAKPVIQLMNSFMTLRYDESWLWRGVLTTIGIVLVTHIATQRSSWFYLK